MEQKKRFHTLNEEHTVFDGQYFRGLKSNQ